MHRDGKQLIPVLTTIGVCDFINDLSRDEIYSAIETFERDFADSEAA